MSWEPKDEKVVRLPVGRTLTEKSRFNPDCKHRAVEVQNWGRDRHVSCKTCGVRLDPVAILADYAKDERRLRSFDADEAQLRQEIEGLEKEKRKLRGQVRRLEESHKAFALLKSLRAFAKHVPEKRVRQSIEDVERRLREQLRGEFEHGPLFDSEEPVRG